MILDRETRKSTFRGIQFQFSVGIPARNTKFSWKIWLYYFDIGKDEVGYYLSVQIFGLCFQINIWTGN